MISVVAKIHVQEDKLDLVVEAFKGLMEDVAKEEGTLMYTMNRDPSAPNTLVILERYKDRAAFDAHCATPHFKAFFHKAGALLSGKPEIAVMEEIQSI